MILVDSRTGSKELFDYFPEGKAELTQLDAGDFAFLGYVDGEPVQIGVERMTLRDFVNKVWSGRLYDVQIPKMMASYHQSYIILEGWYEYADGYVLTSNGKRLVGGAKKSVTYQQLQSMLFTLMYATSVLVLRTDDARYTTVMLLSLEHWWSKDATSHRSHLKVYAPHPSVDGRQFYASRLIHQVARQLPGIGDGKCLEVAAHFGSVQRMVSAGEEEWREIAGVGKATAKRIVEAVREIVT